MSRVKKIIVALLALAVVVLGLLMFLSRTVPVPVSQEEAMPYIAVVSDGMRELVVVEFQVSNPWGQTDVYVAESSENENKIVLRHYRMLFHPFSGHVWQFPTICMPNYVHHVDGKYDVYYGDVYLGYLETIHKKVHWRPAIPSFKDYQLKSKPTTFTPYSALETRP